VDKFRTSKGNTSHVLQDYKVNRTTTQPDKHGMPFSSPLHSTDRRSSVTKTRFNVIPGGG